MCKKSRIIGKRTLATLVAVCLLFSGTSLFAESDDAAEGAAQGKADAHASGWWFFSGLILPGLGILLPWFFAPDAPTENLIGKSAEYVKAYSKAYSRKAALGNFLWALGGSATTVVVLTVVVASAASSIGEGCGNSISDSCSQSCSPNLSCTPTNLQPAALSLLLAP